MELFVFLFEIIIYLFLNEKTTTLVRNLNHLPMTVQEVANRLVELCRSGQFDQCYHELFATDAEAFEMPGFPFNNHTKGVDALLAKSKDFAEKTEAVHAISISDPLVQGDTFAVGMMIDMTEKGKDRVKSQEICAYVVKDGKIVSEHFIYSM